MAVTIKNAVEIKKKKIRRKRSFLLNVIREEVRHLSRIADNTGMYVRYVPITRDEVIEFCKHPETLSGSEGFAEKIEKQIEYKDLISRKYTKKKNDFRWYEKDVYKYLCP